MSIKMKLKSSNYKAHTKVSSYVICVVITAVTLITAFGVLYIPFRQCSAHYVDYRIAATSQNDTRVVARTQHLTYDECTDDKQRYDVINGKLMSKCSMCGTSAQCSSRECETRHNATSPARNDTCSYPVTPGRNMLTQLRA